ncbi:MAG TPA: sulfite exporter TauE/SafE family protein [Candidatus Dormibacteraeota bacterium]
MALAIALLVGLGIGVLSGALGVGGGGVMVPVLVLVLGIDQATAQGTSLLAIIPTAASGAYEHLRQGAVDLRLSAVLGAAGTIGAAAGALVALHVQPHLLRQVFALYLLLVGAQTLYRALRPTPRRVS